MDYKKNDLLTIKEVSNIIGISEHTVRNWIKNGTIKALKPGRSYKIKYSDVAHIIGDDDTKHSSHDITSSILSDISNFKDASEMINAICVSTSLLSKWPDQFSDVIKILNYKKSCFQRDIDIITEDIQKIVDDSIT